MYCNFVQWRLACHLENTAQPTGLLVRHLQKCTRCRQQYQRMRQINQHLQTRDPDLPDFKEETLRDRIIAHLPDSRSRTPALRRQTWRFSMIPAVGLAAVLLITTALWWVRQAPQPNPAPPTHADLARFSRLMNAQIDPLRSDLIGQSMQQSLEKELDNLAQDAEKAVRFFAACLPQAGEKQIRSAD